MPILTCRCALCSSPLQQYMLSSTPDTAVLVVVAVALVELGLPDVCSVPIPAITAVSIMKSNTITAVLLRYHGRGNTTIPIPMQLSVLVFNWTEWYFGDLFGWKMKAKLERHSSGIFVTVNTFSFFVTTFHFFSHIRLACFLPNIPKIYFCTSLNEVFLHIFFTESKTLSIEGKKEKKQKYKMNQCNKKHTYVNPS